MINPSIVLFNYFVTDTDTATDTDGDDDDDGRDVNKLSASVSKDEKQPTLDLLLLGFTISRPPSLPPPHRHPT